MANKSVNSFVAERSYSIECAFDCGSGMCDPVVGACVCDQGWSGRSCSDIECCGTMLIGLIAGVIGMALACIAYKVYRVWARSNKVDVPEFFPRAKISANDRDSLGLHIRADASLPRQAGADQQHPGGQECAGSKLESGMIPGAFIRVASKHSVRSTESAEVCAVPTGASNPSPSAQKTGDAPQAAANLRRSGQGQSAPSNPKTLRQRPSSPVRQVTSQGPCLQREQGSVGASTSLPRDVGAQQHRRGRASYPPATTDHSQGSPAPAARPASQKPPLTGNVQKKVSLSTIREVIELEQRIDALMAKPFAERKHIFKQLLLEHHPDKSLHPLAKDLFQAVNERREDFLRES